MSALDWLEEVKSAEGLQTAFQEHGPRLAAALLAALLAIQAGFLVTTQNTGAGNPTAPGFRSAARPGSAAPGLQLSGIIAAHLFGETRVTSSDADAPQTIAPLVLAGVLAVPDPKHGLAIIGASAGSAKLYAVGSTLPGGVRLYAVYPDRVLLDRDGAIESLLLPRKLASVAPPPAPTGNLQNPAQRLATLAQGSGGLLGGLLRAQPVFAGGKLTGYRIFPGNRVSTSAFAQLGLRAGDLVTAVNGTALDDPNRGDDILQTLSSAATADLTVQRNGQTQNVNLNLQAVVNEAESAAAQQAATERRGGAFGGPLGGAGHFPGLAGAAAPADEPTEHAAEAQ